nr:putative FAD-like protein [Salmonid herpesvirus 1]
MTFQWDSLTRGGAQETWDAAHEGQFARSQEQARAWGVLSSGWMEALVFRGVLGMVVHQEVDSAVPVSLWEVWESEAVSSL